MNDPVLRLALALAILVPAAAAAAPAGEKVVKGEATFTRDGSLTLITTSTPRTIVNYSSFDIGRSETVRIDQPSRTSMILNNVLSTDPTQIDGMLTSNGQVWIANPVGVFFGDQAIVDVGRLVAAAGTVDTGEFLAGTEHFSQLAGRVEVGAGAQIRAADSVLLVGAAVANYGNISATDGMIALVAGGEVRLARVDGRVVVTADRAVAPDPERWGVVQAGELDAGSGGVSLTAGDAYSLAINHTGITRAHDIAIAGGEGGLVSVSGALDASDRSAGATGGEIAVTGDYVSLRGAQLDASGAAGGGRIRVGGDLRGAGDLANAKQTQVDAGSTLRADAIETGDGGRIIVWSDDATRFYGALSARGGAAGGNGGFAEISGASLVARGSVDLGASAGSTGTLLYDPKDIVLHAGTLDGSDDPDDSGDLFKEDGTGRVKFKTPDELLTPFDVYESELENTDANIVLEATNSISSGDTFGVQLTGDRSLTMETRNKAGDETGTSLAPGIHLAGVSFSTAGGDITLTTGNGSIEIGDLSTHGTTGAVGGAGGDVTIRAGGTGSLTVAAIDASGGDGTAGRGGDGGVIALEADRDPDATATGSGARVITVNGDLLARGGNGVGSASDETAEGGSGGRIALTAGVLADEGGSIALGSLADPVTLDTSGGDGTAGGGDASLTAISLAAHGDVDVHAEMISTGGNTTSATPGGFGGQGGVVSIASETGDVTLNDIGGAPIVRVDGGDGQTDTIDIDADGVPHFGGQGGSAGKLDVTTSGTGKEIQVLGLVRGVGGDGLLLGAGGAGGTVTLTAADGAVTISDVDVHGGSGDGSVTTAQGAAEAQGVKGGNGGSVTVTANAGTGEDAAGGGNAFLAGTIVSLGGTGVADPDGDIEDPNENHGVAGKVSITSALDITAAPGATGPRIEAGTIALDGRNVFAGSSAPLVLASSGATGPASFDDTATVTAGNRDEALASTGNVDVRLDDGLALDRFEIAERDTRGHVFVRSEDGSALIAEGDGADGTGTVHNIASIDTQGLDTHFTYRLADGGNGPVDQIDVSTLVVGGVNFGTSGGTIANAREDETAPGGQVLLGRIESSGSVADITLNSDASGLGNLQLFATNIGVAGPAREPLTVAGATGTPAVEMTASGDVDLDAGGTVGLVELIQRRASGDVNINLPNGAAGSEVLIDGTVVDNGSSRVESARITHVDTTVSQTSFLFQLAPTSASTEGLTSGEPVLSIASGAVTLGGDAVFSSVGNLVLDAGAAPAIDANGNAVALVADANNDKTGAVVASGGTDVDDAGLLALTGEGVGTEIRPFRTRTTGTTVVTGSGGTGDFRVINEAGGLEIGTVAIDTVQGGEPLTQTNSGITAIGDVVLDNGDRTIVLGALVQPEEEALVPHVASGGSQHYASDLLISNVATFRTDADDETSTVTKNAAALVATDGDITFDGDIDTHPDRLAAGEVGSLAVKASETIVLGGDVGHDAGGTPTIDELVLSDARLTAGSHTITVASADFAALDGPGSLALRGLRLDPGVESLLTFRDNVGASLPLAGLDADADRIAFSANHETGTRADRIVAGNVALNTANPSTSTRATIVDTAGGLSIVSAGDVTIGAGEKLSSTERLAIKAAGTATLSDLSATQIDVKAAQIRIQSRAPGLVALPNGALVQDNGVDWVANEITTNVVPQQAGAGPAPTFVLGSGGIQTGGGPVPFDVVRFTPEGDEVRSASFASDDGILDLVGLGPRVVPDASRDVPAAAPPVLPGLAARPGDEPPSPPRVVASQEVIAALHCHTASGEPCVATAVGDDPLATERAHEIVARYRELIGSEAGQEKLRASFAPLAASSTPGAALARDPALGPARERIGELAVTLTQVELLGLEREQSGSVRRAIAADFAAATGVAGLDADAVLAAVDASGVAVLP
jgi:trimeric autotransporter adhesin